jgi:hypothetical protein
MLCNKLHHFSPTAAGVCRLATYACGGAGRAPLARRDGTVPAERRSRAEEVAGHGDNQPEKAVLSDGKLQHEAHIQSIDVQNNSFTSSRGTELNFKDSYKFNIAAYRLDKIMDLNMIPVFVVRKVAGKTSAVTWWVDDKMFDDVDRKKQGIEPPNQDDWNKQMYVVRVFDQLIYNTDRNLGNLVIDKSGVCG